MFTGIVEKLGRVKENRKRVLRVEAKGFKALKPGASLAVNGVCLTVVKRRGDAMDFDVSPETLRLTTSPAAPTYCYPLIMRCCIRVNSASGY